MGKNNEYMPNKLDYITAAIEISKNATI